MLDQIQGFRLSPQQRRVWLLQQNSYAYHAQCAILLEGNLKIEILKQALRQVINRHEILRTTFHHPAGISIPVQLIANSIIPTWSNINLADCSPQEQEAKIKELFEQARCDAFDFEHGPLLRSSLLTLSAHQYVLLIGLPSICADAWTLKNLVKELSHSYQACLQEEEISLDVFQYIQFSEWQHELMEDENEDSQKAKEEWLEQDIYAFPSLKLPFANDLSQEAVFQPESFTLAIELDVVTKLEVLVQRYNTSTPVFLLACWQTLLWRITGQSDFIIGMVCDGRKYEELHDTMGLLAKTFPAHCDFKEGLKFSGVLASLTKAINYIDTWQEYFIWNDNDQEKVTSNTVGYSAISFEFEELPSKQLADGVSFSVYKQYVCIDRFKIKLSCIRTDTSVFTEFHYDTNAIEAADIKRLAAQFHTLLRSVTDNPQTTIELLQILSASEKHQLLVEWNDTKAEYPQDKCIHQLFESQVQKTPHSVAVVFENQQLTYLQLNQRANQLAHHLLSLGVGPEVLVGICVERSVEMLVGLLGILKAGGAYVPLDPEYPQERLAYMLNDSQVPVLLTQTHLLDLLPAHEQVICLDTDWLLISSQSESNPISDVKSSNLAYVIYTSGSTGLPKGTMILHQGVVNYLTWCTKAYTLSEGTGAPVQSSIAFDATITSLFSPLLVGQKVVLLPQKQEMEALSAILSAESDFSLVKLTPAHLEVLAQLLPAQIAAKPTKALVIGGEALLGKSLSFWHNYAPNTRLFNEYGPTETVVGCCVYEVTQTTSLSQAIPIGRPIANTHLYILDQFGQPVPIGVSGELYIAGVGLARGYLNRPELTTEKFIPNPFSDAKSERLYKTGDQARYNRDGNIEYLGRIDNQVKIRGFRIELGEIEVVLNNHPQIQQAVVLATEDIPGNKRLVAYVVPPDESLTTNQLREFLKQKLPEYMVPSAFVTLDTLPLTPNGKIDKKALPAPDGEITPSTLKVTPRTPSEEIIANIFALVLGVQNVGIHDNFFTLGGHSLLATQLISRLRVAFAVEISIRAVFESPTVTQLDQTITQLRTVDSGLILPPIQPIEGDTELLPLSWAQERLWFLNQLEGSSATYNIPAAVRITGNLDINALQQALSEIVQRHSVLRTSFQTVNGIPRQVIHPEATMNINVVDLQQLSITERETLLEQLTRLEAITSFDLETAPLIRCSVLHLSATEYVLLLTMHHIVSDGWSMGVFIRELCALYQASCDGVASQLLELPIQYADFAVWQRQWLSGFVLETQLNYWLTQLHGAPSLLQLPTDRPRPVVQTYQGRTQSFTVLGDLTQKLQILSSESGTTLFMTLLAAFATLLYRYSGQSDILVGTPIANRNRSEIESLIGFFVNTLVLRTRFEANPSFENLLALVRETTLKAYEYQDVPFEQVVEALQPQRSLSHSPLFQVMFVWQNAPLGEVELPGVTLTQLDHESTIAKFDLTLSMSETDLGLVGEWEYNTDLFDGSTIERMAGHFQNLLSAIVENPQVAVGEIPLLSEAERHQLLREWNDTESVYPTDKCIHQLFEEQVEKTPLSVAVVFENQQLTYLQLNQRANQLAYHLQTLGVGPEVLVGICVERSVEMVVGLLGILKAGGAYVPLDPAYPQERLSYMLADSGVEVLLTHGKLLESLPQNQARVVCLDTDWGAIEQHNKDNLDAGVGEDNLAYVIYTSGSTGVPKGVAIVHHSPVALCHWAKQTFTISQLSGVLAATSICFDLSVFELFVTLCVGGKVIVAHNALHIPSLNTAEEITLINTVPSAIAELLRIGGIPPQVQTVNLAGEPLQNQIVEQLYQHQNIVQVYNLYGPSEDTTYSTFALVPKGTTKPPSIGRPISNTQIYILDEYHQPVPIGVPGELYIGGDGLARGYLNRPELTLEKFIPNPFSDAKSERLYKTGDQARYNRDGNIEYLGRIDNQVKIRGFRIELGEIEAVLNTHPQIQQAVVIATEDISGNKRACAYVVLPNESLTTNQLREFLKQKLPEYMVPSAFVTLDTLPLTPNGKIDKKALPAPDGEITPSTLKVTPRTPSEEIIANIFALVLGVQNVGIHDNFFTLGGHSLLATQLISRLRVAFAVEISIRAVFESPTVTQLDQTITQLRTVDSGLILPPIQPIEGDTELLPLSWAQERLWFLNQLEGSSATYNIPAAVRITGNLDINALQQALSEIVQRHSVLRTSFQTVNGIPRQVIHPEATMNINVVDLQQLSITERETLLEQLTRLEAITSFDLETAPLIRCSVLHLSATEYVLLLTMHHIVSDGWSMGVFIRELCALYQASCDGVASQLLELPIQYADFAVWQRQWLSGFVLETQLNYWLTQLHGAPSLLQLPTDRPRPVVQTYQGRTQSFTVLGDLTQKLQILSSESGTTLFMTLLAAFATLLYRYSGQSDILVGTPIANRNRSEIESLIGFFVNTLVLRTRFEANPSFENLLALVRETTLKAYEYQDVPFEQVVEALQPQRSLSHSPLFQVMFVWQNAPLGEVELPGVTLTQLDHESTIAKFDLTLSMSETDLGLVGEWEYNTDLFDGSTIERMAGHFQNLLSAIVENPQVAVGEIPLLSEAERHQLLREWNDTESVYPTDKCIHQLFEEQVEKTPLSVAVVFENQQLTYLQLNQRANQLAYHLQTLGVGPEVLVGICVERSVEMVVGLLGILKAGGAYVPLDPAYPQERLSYMLADSGVEVLLTHGKLLESLPQNQARVVCLDTDWGAIEQHNKDNLDAGVGEDNLAYVIYTSGSTGVPKGVAIVHHSPVALCYWAKQTFTISQLSGVLAATSICFDLSVFELFVTLCVGGKVIVAHNALHIPSLNTAEEITLINTVPSAIAELLRIGGIPPQVQTVNLAGEPLQNQIVEQLYQHQNIVQVYNLYGPSEDTTYSTFALVPKGTTKPPSIGRPISNTQIYILDEYHQPVPIGVPGELYIGGDGLARGYLNRPELTLEKFIPNPFSDAKSERLYKTGDQARYNRDGNIEYLGRIDNQVKIRGFRIELGEIEAVLNTHPQIQQAVVIATEDISGNKRACAYVVLPNESLTTNQLREFLKQKLPEYMVPSAFVTLDNLPLTPNGKIDRKALPTPDGEITRATVKVTPRTPSEEIIANIFASVLGVQNVGIHDNFFTLGGHSLLATQLISQLRLAFTVEIPIRAVFESPTIAQLDQTITELRTTESGLTLPPIQPIEGDTELLPLSWAQERLWFLNQLEGLSATYNMPGAVRISGNLDINALQQTLSEIVRRHEILRTSFQTVNGTPIQVIHPEATMNINVVDLQQLSVTERETVLHQQAQLEAITPFNLENAPLIRCSLLHICATEYMLLLTMHHIVCDGWSIGVFMSELSALYQASCAGEPSPLPELPIQYLDFAVWQRQWLSGVVLETQLNYWRDQLHGAPELLQLPTDRPRPVVQTYRGRTQSFTLVGNLTQKLQSISRESGTTLFMTLLATFATLLYRYSGQSDILVGMPIANRNRSEVESLIGFFVNTLVLRTRFEANPSFESLLAQVRETILKAYEHQDVPFEQVVEALQPQRSLAYSPLFQVLFVLQNAPLGEVELPGLTLKLLSSQTETAKFDLVVSMQQTSEELVSSWEYSTDLFDGSTIERMAAHYQNLLLAITKNPQQKVSQIPLLTDSEKEHLLLSSNNIATSYLFHKYVHLQG